MKVLTCLLLFVSYSFLKAQEKYEGPYNPKRFHTLYDFFEYKDNLVRFFDIHPGETIAGVGASNGYHEGALSLLYDSITFYIEDVSPKKVSRHAVKKMARHYSRMRSAPQTCTFIPVLGTYTQSNLPDGKFDKITLIASFHEFSNMDEMMQDLAKKLKPDGKLYIMEAFCIDKVISCEEGHKGYYMKEVNTIMNKAGLYQTQMESPESNIVDHVNILVFEKNKAKSDRFFERKEQLQPYIDLTKLLDTKEVASDSSRTQAIGDSLAKQVKEVKDLYIVYDEWIKGIGQKWQQKKEYTCAANVLKVAVQLFPSLPQNYEVLGEVYAEQGKKEQSLDCDQKAQQLRNETTKVSKPKEKVLSIGL